MSPDVRVRILGKKTKDTLKYMHGQLFRTEVDYHSQNRKTDADFFKRGQILETIRGRNMLSHALRSWELWTQFEC